jgi:uncharacterized membrane protein YfcA
MSAAAETLTAGLGWPVVSLLLGLSFLTSFMTAAFGIGGGAVMLAVLASLLPVAAVIPVHGLVQFGSNVGRTAIFLRHVFTPVLLPFLLGSLVGVTLGGSMVVTLSPALLQMSLGLFILWTVWLPPPGLFRRSAALVGGFSSFLTMFFGGTGPFVAAFVKAQDVPRMTYVGTHAALMTMQHLLKTIVFGFLGFAFAQWLPLVGLLVAVGFLGTLAGRQMLTRIEERYFRMALTAILTVLALRLVWVGAQGVLAPESG